MGAVGGARSVPATGPKSKLDLGRRVDSASTLLWSNSNFLSKGKDLRICDLRVSSPLFDLPSDYHPLRIRLLPLWTASNP